MNALCDKCPYQKTCVDQDHCPMANEDESEKA